ncbi:hypothetical protein VTN31DRAFT_2485 [Thermomyces dupontii]|uniref:uncharacterized protein n=1 Tax=Talaromyces thermophilus TaxID=28565 RepID=UPI003742289E
MSLATAVSQTPTNLSSNDAAVLQALFDSDSPPTQPPSSSVQVDPSLPAYNDISDEDLQSLKSREVAAIRQVNSPSPQDPETSIREGIAALTALIEERPTYASAYANRAQARRLLLQPKRSDGNSTDSDEAAALFYPENRSVATDIFSDLSTAIHYASSSESFSSSSRPKPVPSTRAKVLADSYTHRGYILLRAARLRKDTKDAVQGGPEQIASGYSQDELEEMASRDFFLGGQYGNEVAKQLSVRTNPYAKMCGAIVKEMLSS